MESDKRPPFEAQPEQLAGVYSNSVVITHSPNEFVLDFISHMPAMATPQLRSRVVLTPDHAKRMLAALEQNLKNFEAEYGEIELRRPMQSMPLRGTYHGPKGEA